LNTEEQPFVKMDIQTHPSNAVQAKSFIAPGSLSFPGGAGELTPPSSEADKHNVQRNGQMNGSQQQQGAQAQNGNGVTPATPAATPGATQGVSGIVPTLQYVYPLNLILNT
jgi:transcription initiation factor TFIID TATA-box-binding protein